MQSLAEDPDADQMPLSVDNVAVPATKMEVRRARAEEQRIDAARVRSEMATAAAERDARTIQLRALRLAKEAADREAAAAMPRKVKAKARKVAAR